MIGKRVVLNLFFPNQEELNVSLFSLLRFHSTVVEFQLLSFKDVPVGTTDLTWARCYTGCDQMFERCRMQNVRLIVHSVKR